MMEIEDVVEQKSMTTLLMFIYLDCLQNMASSVGPND